MDMRQLQQLVRDRNTDWLEYGQVTAHYSGDLVLFNYKTAAEYENRWNWFERNSRGLILNWKTGEIVARPFEKFWNWNQGGRKAFGHIVTVTEKMDGSLGIFYRDENGDAKIATRGSFDSEQAVWAEGCLYRDFGEAVDLIPDEYTLLFEIIYPENRVVVDYGGYEGLVLLAIRNKDTGEFLPFYPDVYEFAQEFGFDLPPVFTFNNVGEILEATDYLSLDSEGYVVEFANGKRFKFKGDAYVELHRMISKLSFKRVLSHIQNTTYHVLLDGLPDEFLPQVEAWRKEIEDKVSLVKAEVDIAYYCAPKESRKEFALWVKENAPDLAPYLFAKLDGKDDVRWMILAREFND